MGMFDRQQELFAALRQHLQGLFPADDPMQGAFVGVQSKTFSKTTYGVAASQYLLALQPVDRKFQPSGDVQWLRHSDIASSSAWGEGGGLREKLSVDADFQLRFTTTGGEKFKIEAFGGWTMTKMMGDDYIHGLSAVAEWMSRRPS